MFEYVLYSVIMIFGIGAGIRFGLQHQNTWTRPSASRARASALRLAAPSASTWGQVILFVFLWGSFKSRVRSRDLVFFWGGDKSVALISIMLCRMMCSWTSPRSCSSRSSSTPTFSSGYQSALLRLEVSKTHHGCQPFSLKPKVNNIGGAESFVKDSWRAGAKSILIDPWRTPQSSLFVLWSSTPV